MIPDVTKEKRRIRASATRVLAPNENQRSCIEVLLAVMLELLPQRSPKTNKEANKQIQANICLTDALIKHGRPLVYEGKQFVRPG